MQHAEFKLVEELTGVGQLLKEDAALGEVRYALNRYQGVLVGSGMPVPGLHRIDGSVDFETTDRTLLGRPLTLRLEDGRALAITLATTSGRILCEGHGPAGGCSCC